MCREWSGRRVSRRGWGMVDPGAGAGERDLSHSVCKVHGPRGPASSRGKKGIIKKCKVTHIFFYSLPVEQLRGCCGVASIEGIEGGGIRLNGRREREFGYR